MIYKEILNRKSTVHIFSEYSKLISDQSSKHLETSPSLLYGTYTRVTNPTSLLHSVFVGSHVTKFSREFFTIIIMTDMITVTFRFTSQDVSIRMRLKLARITSMIGHDPRNCATSLHPPLFFDFYSALLW